MTPGIRRILPAGSAGRIALLGLAGVAAAIVAGLLAGDMRVLGAWRVRIEVPGNDRLAGAYCPGSRRAGVVILEGFGSDQTAMRAPAGAFCRMGAHVLTLDFSGHGRSPGALGFDNAATDRLARQAAAAIDELRFQAGLSTDDIIVWGHSMGARVALQAASLFRPQLAGLVLVGAQVNLAPNTQSELFTGARDVELAWVQDLGARNPATDILIITGGWDDVLTPDAAHLLLRKLTGDPAAVVATSYGAEGATRELILVPALLHNYEPFSPRALNPALAWAARRWGFPGASLRVGYWRIAGWVVGLGAIFGSAALPLKGSPGLQPLSGGITSPSVRVVRPGRFVWVKLALWIPALPIAGLLGGAFFLVPLGLPAFNLIYVGFIGSYGLLLCALYRAGRMPGIEGRLRPAAGQAGRPSDGRLCRGLVVWIFILVLTALYAQSGWFAVPPVGARLVWLVIFTPVTAVGFWVGAREWRMPGAPRAAITLTNLAPFFLWAVVHLAIGSLSGFVASAHGLIILALAILTGQLIERLSERPWLAAFCQAVLLYWLILPQGALFAV